MLMIRVVCCIPTPGPGRFSYFASEGSPLNGDAKNMRQLPRHRIVFNRITRYENRPTGDRIPTTARFVWLLSLKGNPPGGSHEAGCAAVQLLIIQQQCSTPWNKETHIAREEYYHGLRMCFQRSILL